MALGKRSNSMNSRRIVGIDSEEGLVSGFVKYTRSFGRKRILISNHEEDLLALDSPIENQLKRLCSLEPEKSALESVPQDILIKVLCGVDHDDLKQLFHVSSVIREATVIAKKWHFAYRTPTKTLASRNAIDFENNAPKQQRSYKALNEKNLAGITVALFTSPRKGLFVETEV